MKREVEVHRDYLRSQSYPSLCPPLSELQCIRPFDIDLILGVRDFEVLHATDRSFLPCDQENRSALLGSAEQHSSRAECRRWGSAHRAISGSFIHKRKPRPTNYSSVKHGFAENEIRAAKSGRFLYKPDPIMEENVQRNLHLALSALQE